MSGLDLLMSPMELKSSIGDGPTEYDTDLWITLQPPTWQGLQGNVLNLIHRNQFMIVLRAHPDQEGKFLIYDMHQHTWKQHITKRYPAQLLNSMSPFVLNKDNHKLYMYNHWAQMTIIDLEGDTVEVMEDCGVNDKAHPLLIAANGEIHLIGAQKYDDKTGINAKHFVWNDDLSKFTQLTCFPQFSDICGSAAIFIPGKQAILHVGGVDDDYESDLVSLHQMFIYSLETKAWTALPDIEFEGSRMELILTPDQRNVLIVGGDDNDGESTDAIYVVEIDYTTSDDKKEYVLRKSDVVCPMVGRCHIAVTGGLQNEMLATGFIKHMFKSSEFKNMQLLPLCVVKMIVAFHSDEMLHWFKYGSNSMDHFAISIDKIV